MDMNVLKKILKEVLAAVLIIALAFGMELIGFNYRTFVKGETADILYQPGGEVPEELEAVEKKYYRVRLLLKEPTYIKKMQVILNTPEKTDYSFYVRYDNAFKAEELEKVTDAYWPELGSGFTNLDKDVKVLTLSIPKGTELVSVRLYSRTALNKYRLLFLMIVLLFLYVIFTKKQWFVEHLDWTTAGTILILGCFTDFFSGS